MGCKTCGQRSRAKRAMKLPGPLFPFQAPGGMKFKVKAVRGIRKKVK